MASITMLLLLNVNNTLGQCLKLRMFCTPTLRLETPNHPVNLPLFMQKLNKNSKSPTYFGLILLNP